MGRMKKECKVQGCERNIYSHGFCRTHCKRWKEGLPLRTPIRDVNKNHGETCTIEGCHSLYYSKGLCKVHYYKIRYEENKDAFNATRRKCYQRNREEFIREKRKRYAEDKEFRERKKEINKQSYHKRKGEKLLERYKRWGL